MLLIRYFILKGLERVVRLLVIQKRNYPMSMVRSSFRGIKEGYSDKAVSIRCVRDDQSSVTVRLYYLNNGSARLGFWIRGREYLLPVGVVLKALRDSTDHEVYVALTCSYNEKFQGVKGAIGTQLVGERAKIILDELHGLSLLTHHQCLDHIGGYFQPLMYGLEKESFSVVGEAVLKKFIFVHLHNNHKKFNLLIFMLQKLFSLIDQTSVLDNPDALQNQEVLQAGQLIAVVLKAKLEDWLASSKQELIKVIEEGKKSISLSVEDIKVFLRKNTPRSVSTVIETMLKTGNISKDLSVEVPQSPEQATSHVILKCPPLIFGPHVHTWFPDTFLRANFLGCLISIP
ncbi:DNA-directed RNA polymerase I subunit RPA2 [Dionaea muscipula]